VEDITGRAAAPRVVDYGQFSFSVKRWALTALAEHVAPSVSSSDAVPVLSCFRVRVGPDRLQLTGSNTVLSIVAESPAVSGPDEEHTCYIPAKKLLSILKEADDGDFTVAVSGNQAKLTTASGVSWTQVLPDGSRFPELPDLSGVSFAPVRREDFLAGLRRVRHTVGKDASNAAHMQVAVTERDGSVVVTSTSGSRCTRAPLPGFPGAMAIPAGALDHLVRILGAPDEEALIGRPESGVLVFRVGPVTFLANRVMAPFPDVDKLMINLTAEYEHVLGVDREELAAAVRRVRINSSRDTSAIALRLSPTSAVVEARDRNRNSATARVHAKWSGADGRVLTVHHGFLLDMLAAHPSAACEFRVGPDAGKRRSMVMLEDRESGVIGVITQMPAGVVGY
jgi:DNA polymerase III sliding clamp (beta) subunit (PCNA family)